MIDNKNYITLKKLAERLNCKFIGDEHYKIYGIITFKNLKDNNLILRLDDELTYKIIDSIDINGVYLVKRKLIYPNNKNFLIYDGDLQQVLFKMLKIFYDENIKAQILNKNEINAQCIGKNIQLGKNCYIGNNVIIGNNVTILDNVYIGDNTYIGNNAVIYNNTYIGDNVVIYDGCCLGIESFMFFKFNNEYKKCKSIGALIIEENVEIGFNCTIEKGLFENTIIKQNSKIGNLVHIGHDTYIGDNCIIMTQTGIASFAIIEKDVTIFAKCGINNFITIGEGSKVFGGSIVTKSFKEKSNIFGYPAQHKDTFIKQLSFLKKQYNKYKRG